MINSTTIIVLVVLCVLALTLPRRRLILPFIIAACFVPTDQRFVICDLDFTILRVLVVVGGLRILVWNEKRDIVWNRIDRLFMVWAVLGAVMYSLQWLSLKVVINRCGFLFDSLGLFWIFRQLIRDKDDVDSVVKTCAYSSLVLAVLVGIEWATGSNPFAVLGRVGTSVREERYRCQGPFPHSLMLGLFWAVALPLLLAMAKSRPTRTLGRAAVVASVFMICATASSTPLGVLIIVGLLMWGYRYRFFARQALVTLLVVTVILHLVRETPVWHLLARVNLVGGSTGWHRYHLIDQAINHFREWALLGTRSTAHWGWGLEDVTNQFILEGVRGGVWTLIVFVVLLWNAAKAAWRYSVMSQVGGQQHLGWALCVIVIGHCLAFTGVAYFGQITMLLYLHLAAISMVCDELRRPEGVGLAHAPVSLNDPIVAYEAPRWAGD